MGYWGPPAYIEEDFIEEAKYPEIVAEINTLIEHLVSSIKEEAKDDIARTSNAYIDLKTSCDNMRKESFKTREALCAKERMIELLQKELEKKNIEHPTFKYNIGDKVFHVQPNYGYNKKVYCPRCQGKGIVSLAKEGCNLPDDLVNSVITCPECKGSTGGILYSGAKHFKERDCTVFSAETGIIDKIEFVIKNDGTTSTKYTVRNLNSSNSFFGRFEEDLFENREDAQKKAKQETRLAYIEACKGVGIEPKPEEN